MAGCGCWTSTAWVAQLVRARSDMLPRSTYSVAHEVELAVELAARRRASSDAGAACFSQLAPACLRACSMFCRLSSRASFCATGWPGYDAAIMPVAHHHAVYDVDWHVLCRFKTCPQLTPEKRPSLAGGSRQSTCVTA